MDILLGAPNQKLHLLTLAPDVNTWRIANTAWGPKDAAGGTPVLADLNGDRVLDLILADGEGALSYWLGLLPQPKPLESQPTAEGAQEEQGPSANHLDVVD